MYSGVAGKRGISQLFQKRWYIVHTVRTQKHGNIDNFINDVMLSDNSLYLGRNIFGA